MAYRRTEKVARRLASRRDAIIAAARTLAAEGGMTSVQIVPVAERAGIAAGTVYRYFPSKTELVAALVTTVSEREMAAMRQAAAAAPGPLSALAAAIATFAGRALARRNLAWSMIGESAEPESANINLGFRKAVTAEIATRLRAAIDARLIPDQDPLIVAPAIVGALLEGLIGPLARRSDDPARMRESVQMLTLLALRAVGILDARARGLVVQTMLPAIERGA